MKLQASLESRWPAPEETAQLLEPYGEWQGLASVFLLGGFEQGLVPGASKDRARLVQARSARAVLTRISEIPDAHVGAGETLGAEGGGRMSTTHKAPEVGTASRVHRHLTTVLWVVVGLLAAALVALGAWVIVDRYTGPEADATALIDDLAAAWSNGDVDAIKGLYANDVVYKEPLSGGTTSGLSALIAEVPEAVAVGFTMERVAPVTVEGDFATTFVHYTPTVVGQSTVVAVFQLEDGKIVREWPLQPGVTPPLDNAVP